MHEDNDLGSAKVPHSSPELEDGADRGRKPERAQSEPLHHQSDEDDLFTAAKRGRSRSVSTVATCVTVVSVVAGYSDEEEDDVAKDRHHFEPQAVFSVRDGADLASRRASCRRNGPLTALKRERAHLIRKIGACWDCRRRRVAVSTTPLYHNYKFQNLMNSPVPS